MTLPITTLYALPLMALFVALWLHVSRLRATLAVSIGDGGRVEMLERMRRHGNFVEWVPMALILMALAEVNSVPGPWLHAAGVLLVLGRLLHPFGLWASRPTHPLRIAGNSGPLLAMLLLGAALVWQTFSTGL